MNKIKILTVLGARPQFIKAAVISRLIKEKYSDQIEEVLVHTGQHYDTNMSSIFFKEMNIPTPNYQLEVNERTHGAMTGKMLAKVESLLLETMPDLVLVYGDTNSTLAGALAASKLDIPLAHIEAGLRSFWKKMPEEQNRVLTDHVSTFLFCPTETAVNNLANESITEGVYNVGDIMLDGFNFYRRLVNNRELSYTLYQGEKAIAAKNLIEPEDFMLLTIHRAENTASESTLRNIFTNLEEVETKILFPVHPRTIKSLQAYGIEVPNSVLLLNPVGYFEMVNLLVNCTGVITDSGGLQKEAYFAKKKCYTLRNQTEWVETLHNGCNTLLDPDSRFVETINKGGTPGKYYDYFGAGATGEQILETLIDHFE